MSEPTPEMIDAALNAWFKSPPSETDQGLERSMKAALIAAERLRGVAQARPSPTAEDIYACCRSTLIGFRDELTEQQIKFICDQIARKSTLTSTMQLCPDWRTCKCKDGCAHSSTESNSP